MLVVKQNTTFFNWSVGSEVIPLPYASDVVVVFDPSKSNTAVLVGTPDGDILDAIEFSGNNRKRGPVMDTSIFCMEMRKYLRAYLANCNLYLVAVEQVITKRGNAHHHSDVVLKEIRSNLLNFFLEEFGIKVLEINNWSWKAGVLPEGFRGQYQKGSKLWFQKFMPNSPFTFYFEADMTDAVCIYWYVIKNKCATYSCVCNRIESALCEYEYIFVPASSGITSKLREVQMNPKFTLIENIEFYVNRIFSTFWFDLAGQEIELESIYAHSKYWMLDDIDSNTVQVVCKRK